MKLRLPVITNYVLRFIVNNMKVQIIFKLQRIYELKVFLITLSILQ